MTKEKKREMFRMFRIALFSSLSAILVQVFMTKTNVVIAMLAAIGGTLLVAAALAFVMAILEVGYNAKKSTMPFVSKPSGGDIVITGGNGAYSQGGNIEIRAGNGAGRSERQKPTGLLAWIFD